MFEQLNMSHLIAFALGVVAATGKDLIQIWIFNRQMKKLGTHDSDYEMDKLMKATADLQKGFSPNTPVDPEADSSSIEANYKGYFS